MNKSNFAKISWLKAMGSVLKPMSVSGIQPNQKRSTLLLDCFEGEFLFISETIGASNVCDNLVTGKALGSKFVHFDISIAISLDVCFLVCFPRKEP